MAHAPGGAMPVPFANSEELGEAWHSIIGYGKQLHDPTSVETLLRGNPFFLERVFISDDRLFFGPARELLLTEAKRMAPPWSVANHHRFPAAARAYAPRWSFFTSAACWHGGAALAVQELAVEEKVSSSRVGLVRARVEGVLAQTICPKCLWKCGWNM